MIMPPFSVITEAVKVFNAQVQSLKGNKQTNKQKNKTKHKQAVFTIQMYGRFDFIQCFSG